MEEKRISQDDFDIIIEVLTGKSNAYAEIIRRYQEKVRGYCRMAMLNEAQGDDAAQEVFIKAYQSLSSFKGNSKFSTWIYRIAVNHCNDLKRKVSWRKTDSLDSYIERNGEGWEQNIHSQPHSGMPEEDAAIIRKIIDNLPEKSRQMIVLREFEGLSYEQIAEVVDCSLDTVKSRLKRAREELNKNLRHIFNPKSSKQLRPLL